MAQRIPVFPGEQINLFAEREDSGQIKIQHMVLGGFQKLTLIDYPGKLAATVFTSGCSFCCPWCYSPELVLPERIKKHPKIKEKQIIDFLEKRKGMLEGVVVCGGEPTINKDLPEFIKKIKKMGFLVKLDTNGSNPEMLKELIKEKLVDYIAMDIKAPLGAKNQNAKIKNRTFINESEGKKEDGVLFASQNYERAAGVKVDLGNIKKSVEIIKNSGVDYEFRTTVVPGIHSKEDILEITKLIKGAKRYFLQTFRPEKTIDPKFEKIKPYPSEFLLEIQKAIAPFFEICQAR